MGMNIIELGANDSVHWWRVMQIGFPLLVVTAILGWLVRKYWTPERRKKLARLSVRRKLGLAP